MTLPHTVKIVEVSPRDGLQNEKKILPTQIKIEMINRLAMTGLKEIEVTSFVSPKWVPQLADAKDILQGITKKPDVQYPVLIPNVTGLHTALNAGATAIAVFTTPSEKFSQKNTNCSVAESLIRVAEIMEIAKQKKLYVRGYISCVLGCPYEGKMEPAKVVMVANKLLDLGCDEICLGDTIGTGNALSTAQLIQQILTVIPVEKVAVHFHDTYGQALTNIYVALTFGVSIVDSAVAGLGGCPYAKGATGNVATEDLLYMLNGMQIKTGVDLPQLIRVGRFVTQQLGQKMQSKVNLATHFDDEVGYDECHT